MKYLVYLFAISQLTACASANISQKLNFVAFEEKINPSDLKSVGTVDGKDCTWYLWSHSLGDAPSVRKAFANTTQQQEQGLVPGMDSKSKGENLKVVKNISVEDGGFSAWIVSRQCITVTGAGYR